MANTKTFQNGFKRRSHAAARTRSDWQLDVNTALDFPIYVHSSLNRFSQGLKDLDFINEQQTMFQLLNQGLSQRIEILQSDVDYHKILKNKQADPHDILSLFVKDGNNILAWLNKFKSILLTFTNNKAGKVIEKLANTQAFIKPDEMSVDKWKEQQRASRTLPVIHKDGSIGYNRKSAAANARTSCANLQYIINSLMPSVDPPLELPEAIRTGIERLYNLDRPNKAKLQRDVAAIQQQQVLHDTLPNTQSMPFEDAKNFFFDSLKQLLTNIMQQTKNNSPYQDTFDSWISINTLSEFLKTKKKVTYTDMGKIYEQASLLVLQQGGDFSSVKSTGTSGANKWNSTDIEVMMSEFTTTVGASIKQQVDFNKTIATTVDTMSNLDLDIYGENGEVLPVHFSPLTYKKYMYFIMNYTMLKNEKISNVKMEVSLQDMQKMLDSYLQFFSRYAFTTALLGPALKNAPRGLSSQGKGLGFAAASGGSIAPPFILVTEHYACFTYDLLANLKNMLSKTEKAIEVTSNTMTVPYIENLQALKDAKHQALSKKKDDDQNEIPNYQALKNDALVHEALTNINNVFGCRSDTMEGSFNVTIHEAKMMEKYNNLIKIGG